jgi:hypothetical protein
MLRKPAGLRFLVPIKKNQTPILARDMAVGLRA